MKNYLKTGLNWLNRINNYGLRNALVLKKNLKKDGIFPIMIKGHEFFVRGNTVDFAVLNGIFVKKEYEIDLGFAPEIIIDAGANIGASTLFLRLKYPQARIYAIEPERSNYDLLVRNLKGFDNVVFENAAVWARHTNLKVSNPDAEKYAFQMDETVSATDCVRGMTIEDLMEQWGLSHIDMLKLDIEGAEKHLFDSPQIEWINKVRVLVVELHETLFPGTHEVFLKAIGKIDHVLSQSGENYVVVNRSFTSGIQSSTSS